MTPYDCDSSRRPEGALLACLCRPDPYTTTSCRLVCLYSELCKRQHQANATWVMAQIAFVLENKLTRIYTLLLYLQTGTWPETDGFRVA